MSYPLRAFETFLLKWSRPPIIVGLCVLVAAVTAYSAWRFGFPRQTEVKENKQVIGAWNDLWFSSSGELITTRKYSGGFQVVVARQLQDQKEIDTKKWIESLRAKFPSVEKSSSSDPFGPDADWQESLLAVRRDGGAIAKYYKGVLVVGTSDDEFRLFPLHVAEVTAPLNAASDLAQMAFMESGLIALVYDDGRVEFRRTDDALVVQEIKLSLTKPYKLRTFGNYLVISSSSDSKYVVIWKDFSSEMFREMTARPLPPRVTDEPFGIAVSKDGKLAIASGANSVHIGYAYHAEGETSLQSSSPVTVLAFTNSDELAVGADFPGNSFGINLLSDRGQQERVIDTRNRVQLLAGDANHIAYVTEGSGFGNDGATTGLLSLQKRRALNPTGKTILSIGGALLLSIIVLILVPRFASVRREKEKLIEVVDSATPDRLLLPDPPLQLVRACAARNCVLYTGAGLSAQAGFLTWQDFMHQLLDWAVENGFMESASSRSFHSEIDNGSADPVADLIVSAVMNNKGLPRLHDYLRQTFLRGAPLPEAITVLREINFSAALSTNFDDLLERSYRQEPNSILTPQNTEELLAALTHRQFFILKLYGTLERADTVMVAPAQYEDAVSGNPEFAECMGTLFRSRTLLFVGASLEGIETYLKGIALPRDITAQHWALVAVDEKAWRAKADFLEQRYRIKVLPFTPSPDFHELKDFLRKLADEVVAQTNTGAGNVQATARLKRVSLKNIGPFESLDLELDRNWNILLGDNGVGKSSILKAIGVALSGEQAKPYAVRLIKAGEKEATIALQTDKGTVYETRLIRKNEDEADLVSNTARPLVAESWLAMGFPPLRTTSWERPKPDLESSGKSRSTPDDILPLVKGDTDPRLDKFKRWIISIDYQRSLSEEQEKGAGARWEKLVNDLFAVINKMSKPLQVRYRGVDPGSRKILVETNQDGPIPIEAVSQGLISLISWVGVLMQRYYEVYELKEDPTKNYALILMDEIDAHMHPGWQRMLVRHLSEVFSNAQFIATTHSPLIVGGMPANQLHRFIRDNNGKVRCESIDPEMTVGRADQILTGDLFRLDTTLDIETQDRVEEYEDLLEEQARAEQSGQVMAESKQKRLLQLENILAFRIPKSGETPPERQAQKLLEALLRHQVGDKHPEAQAELMREAERLFTVIKSRQENISDDEG